MSKFRLLGFLIALLSLSPPLFATQFNYISAEKLEQMLRGQTPVSIVDIQVEPEYDAGHIKGAQPTYAYPVKSDQDRAKFDAVVPRLAGSDKPVVIVCPRGAGGAERAFHHLAEKGIPPSRLLILEQGQAGWNYPDLTEKQ